MKRQMIHPYKASITKIVARGLLLVCGLSVIGLPGGAHAQRSAAPMIRIATNEPIIQIAAGQQRDVVVTVERQHWTDAIPIQVMAFELPRLRPPDREQTGIAGRIRGVAGSATIPAGRGSTQLLIPITVAPYVPQSRYRLVAVSPTLGHDAQLEFDFSHLPFLDIVLVDEVALDCPPLCPLLPPYDLHVTRYLSTSTWLHLVWTDISLTEDGSDLQRRLPPHPEWTTIATFGPITTSNYTNYRDEGLTPFTEYCYRVRVFRTTKETFSEEVCDRTTSPAPAAPTNFTITDTTTTSISLRWYDNAIDETEYEVNRYPAGSVYNDKVIKLPANVGTGWMEWTDSGLTPGEDYCYRLFARKFDGFYWSWSVSPKVCAEAEVPPPPPSTKPDLAHSGSMWVENAEGTTDYFPDPFEPFTVYWTLCNFGGSATGSFTDRVDYSGDGGTKTYFIAESSLAPGNCYLEWVYYSSGRPEGSHDWDVNLDIYNKVIESYETNNHNHLGITIW
jgi:hypothetical protein